MSTLQATPEEASPAFDTEALRRAVTERDSATLAMLYAEDAELVMVDERARPSSARVVRGRTEITAFFDELCGRDMTHALERVLVDGDHAAYLESCAYPDGLRVLCAAVLDLDGGRIVRQTCVQAWDE